ncbi:MAG: polymorphic toxin-type HINT domain-containing protein [Spirochaetota bacterium]
MYIDANGRYGNPGQVNIIKNLTDLENSTDAMIDKHRKDAKDAARIKNIQENLKKLGATPFSTEYLKTLKEEDIAKLSHDIESAAQAEGKKDEAHNTSRPEDQNWLQEAVQEFGDSLGVFSGKVADKDGWVDSLGRFHQRTCFVAGTLVHTKNGLKKIEEIQVGDIVLTKDENTGKSLYRKVTELFYHEVDTLFVLKLGNGETIQTTWNHPFWIENKGWTEAKDILPGNKLITPEGVLEVLSNHQKYVSDISVYNFEVEETHSYFVGEIGFWVHNYDLKNTIHYQTFITAGGKGNTETAKGAKKLNKEVDEYYRKKKEKFDEEHKALEEKIQAERGIDIVKGAEIYMKGKEHMYWEGGSTGADGKSIDCSSYMMRGLEISQYLKEFEYLDPRYFKNSPYFNKVNDQDVKAGDIRTAYFKDKKGKLHSHAYMYTGLKDEKLKILEFSPSSGYTRAGEDTTVNFHYDKDYLFTNSKKWKNQGAYRTKITKNYYIRKAEELDIKNRSRQEKHWKIFRKEHPNDSFDMEVDCRKRLYGHCRP